jgi:hypothetical protein
MLAWFDTKACVQFAQELAAELLEALASSSSKREHKFSAKAEKALVKAEAKVREFKMRERMNLYKRSRLANEFLWALRDGGCSPEYATELTEWLTHRL